MAVLCSLSLQFARGFRRTVVSSLRACLPTLGLLLSAYNVQSQAFGSLTSAAAVHKLSRDQASRQLPLHLLATVSYYDAIRQVLFVEDKSGGVYVETSKPYPLLAGDLIDLVGTTQRSLYGDVSLNPIIRVVGRRPLARPVDVRHTEISQLTAGKWNSQRVTIHAVVRSALIDPVQPDRLELEMLMGGSVMQASVLHPGKIEPTQLIDSEVALTGTLGATYNAKLQFISLSLYSNQGTDLKVLHRAAFAPSYLPFTPVDDVLKSQSTLDQARRVRVQGTVTYYRPGRTLVIQQNGSSIVADTWQRTAVAPGSVVDLSGFAYQGESGPVLKQVMFKATGSTELLRPATATYEQVMGGTLSDELISTRGRIVSQNHSETADTLTLLVDRHQITVDLIEPLDGTGLPALRPGSEVQVTGICRVTLTTGWDGPRSRPAFFRIDMRSANDLKVLSQPPWWTVDRLLKLFAVVCFISLVLTLWAIALRRRVSQQTAKLKDSMRLEQERSRMLQAISSDAPLRDLLANLCATCEALLPHVTCGCSVTADNHLCTQPFQTGTAFADDRDLPLYEARIEDGHGALLGFFLAGPQQRRALTEDEQETLDVFAGLATLAVNQRRMYQELNYTSTHDQLTGLPNRRLADSCLELALQGRLVNGSMVAVVYIDLDHFKQVNDRHGHKIGDQYLQLIAMRMRSAVRSTDTLARVGGDEFLLIASGVTEIEEGERYRDRLEACFAEPFALEGVDIVGAASIGVAIAPEHGIRAEELKRKADLDMYAAKHHHRTGNDLRTVPIEHETYTVADLEIAMEEGRFHLFYQPQCSPDGTLLGLEALLRLNDHAGGIVAPDAFIGVAERNDVIHALGAWVLREAMTDAVKWNLPSLNARMMVNISIRQAEHPDFAASVMTIIEDAGIAPGCVELEITERMLMSDMQQAILQLSQLRKRGVHIAIDDFGVEHSCLSLLHNLPFDTLKLDRTFIRSMHEDLQAKHIVGAVVAMANALGKRVVAEGVETKAQVQALAPFCGVDLQGYYFSRPRPAVEIAHALKTWSNSPITAVLDASLEDAYLPGAMLSSPR